MRLVYPVCCGVDVHKTFLVATIITTTNNIFPRYRQKRFSTYYSGLLDFTIAFARNRSLFTQTRSPWC